MVRIHDGPALQIEQALFVMTDFVAILDTPTSDNAWSKSRGRADIFLFRHLVAEGWSARTDRVPIGLGTDGEMSAEAAGILPAKRYDGGRVSWRRRRA